MKFEKYHGLGNDFIIFMEEDVKNLDYSSLAKRVCHRIRYWSRWNDDCW